MKANLFNAAQARKVANDINNVLHEKLFIKVADSIAKAANRGELKITVSLSDMTDTVVAELKGLGYSVTKHSGDPCSGGSQYIISW